MRSTLYLSVYWYGACVWGRCFVAVWRGGWCDAVWVVSVGIFFGDLLGVWLWVGRGSMQRGSVIGI